MRVFYFGCLRQSGHHWFGEDGEIQYRPVEIPNEFWPDQIYGRLPPQKWDDGIALWTLRVRGEVWTAAAWWDNTIDKCTGSHSVLLADGERGVGELLRAGAKRFPDLKESLSRFLAAESLGERVGP